MQREETNVTEQQTGPEQEVTVLPDATREEMLEAAGMTTGHRWEDTFVSDVMPDPEEDEDVRLRPSDYTRRP
jgi:biotin synthase-related radical SAM superfamily protein